jgi:hypothetical protein
VPWITGALMSVLGCPFYGEFREGKRMVRTCHGVVFNSNDGRVIEVLFKFR